MNDRVQFTKELAVRVGKMAQDIRNSASQEDFIQEKGNQDFVTVADTKVENAIRSAIESTYPNDGILGEEEGFKAGSDGYWVVDPIDGTTNFMRGLADWGVSIAYVKDDVIQLGVVYVPDEDNIFWAEKGKGAFMNDDAICVTKENNPAKALVMTGYSTRQPRADYIKFLDILLESGLEYRRCGSAAVAAVRVAQGAMDMYYEADINAWDMMAGILIVEEAKGVAHHDPIAEFMHKRSPIILSNGALDTKPFEQLCF